MLLRFHLSLTAQREAIQFLVVAQIAEYRFHRGHSLSITAAPIRAINRLFHPLGVGQRRGLRAMIYFLSLSPMFLRPCSGKSFSAKGGVYTAWLAIK